MFETHVMALVTVIFLGVSAYWLAWRLRIPSILLLLTFGFVIGPLTGLIDPDHLLGDLLVPIVSLSVGLILFEGGLTLRFAEIRDVGHVVRNLCSVGALVTMVLTAVAAHYLFALNLGLAVLAGAILTVTGPTVIGPLMRHIRPSGDVGTVLRWEAIIIDPIGAMLAVLVFEVVFAAHAGGAAKVVALGLGKTIIFGGGLGLLAGGVLAFLLARYWIPDYLQNAMTVMLVVVTQALANLAQHEAGLLAVTVMGMTLANQRKVDVRHIVEFKENLRVLLISFLFIVLSARLELPGLQQILWPGVGFVVLLVLVVRPVSAIVSSLGSKLPWPERWFLAWMAPRGIVAAAVSSVFALRLAEANQPRAEVLVPITFFAIIGTVAIYGLTSPWAARRLKVADANPQGILFAGAPAWARALAKMLLDKGYRVRMVDSNRLNIRAARMEGIPAIVDNILSEHIGSGLELGGIGRLFAVTPNDYVNTLAVQRYAPIFGRANCFQLVPTTDTRKAPTDRHVYGRFLFGAELGFAKLVDRFMQGAEIKATPLSEEFDITAYRLMYGDQAAPLLRIRPDKSIAVVDAEKQDKPQPGEIIVGLVKTEEPAPADRKEG